MRAKAHVRETPPSPRFPKGVPAASIEVEWGPEELSLVRELTEYADAHPEERKDAVNELWIVNEFVALFPGCQVYAEEEEQPIQTTLLPDYDPNSPFAPPPKALRKMGVVPDSKLGDPARGEELREEAIGRVSAAAPPDWVETAIGVAREINRAKPEWTTDDVWELLHVRQVLPPPERRAMAAVTRRLQADGVIEKTDRFIQSVLPWAHRRNTQVWRSLVYEGGLT